MFILAIPFTVIELEFASDVLGFAAYVFILTYVIRQLIIERVSLHEA